jgi:uncharacterized repeat protein (TIGR03943 family)
VSRETENAILLLVGISVAMIAVSGAFTRYVKPGLLPWLIASAVLLIVLALVAIIGDIRRGGPRTDGTHDETGDHTEAHSHRAGIVWLLIVPVLILIFVTPPALRPSAAAPSVTTVSNNDVVFKEALPPLPPGEAPEVSLPELLMREFHDSAGSLTNRPITVIGFVLNEKQGVDLGRIVIICCAADAQLARIHLGGPAVAEAAGLPDNTWLRVVGKVTPPPPNSARIPTLQATAVTRIDAPANPYDYPH